MRVRDPKMWRPLEAAECKLALALRDYCFTHDKLPIWQWTFIRAMSKRAKVGGKITDKQGSYLRKMAGWYGVAAPADVEPRLAE
jgi:hypothetical protein